MKNAEKIAVVTGAGSGVGKCVAQKLKEAGWNVALIGRRKQTLDASLGLCVECDVSIPEQVREMAIEVKQKLGNPTVLVNSAGTNVPKRGLKELSVEDFRRIVDVNLNGVFQCVHEFLPAMRAAGGGTIVNIASDAGIIANNKAGTAYISSKFGLRGLTQVINLEERGNGIRACGIFPGEINTPLLDKRPSPPTADARQKMLQPDDLARCVMLAIDLPPRAIFEELLIRPP